METMCAFDVESRLQRWNRNIVLTVKRSLQEEMRCTADREGLFMCTKAKFASRYTDSNIQIGESTHAFLQRRLQNIIVTGANGLVLKRLYLFQCMDERSGDGDTTRQKLLQGRIWGLPMENAAVKRVRNTKPQKLLSDEERKNNLKKAFQARKFIVKYKKILLVDDIYTTGSTVEAVAHELMRCGVEQVFFLTLCTGEGIVM